MNNSKKNCENKIFQKHNRGTKGGFEQMKKKIKSIGHYRSVFDFFFVSNPTHGGTHINRKKYGHFFIRWRCVRVRLIRLTMFFIYFFLISLQRGTSSATIPKNFQNKKLFFFFFEPLIACHSFVCVDGLSFPSPNSHAISTPPSFLVSLSFWKR